MPAAGVKGPPLRDLYAQQKADEELEALLQSQAPGAQAKAFARGMAAGAAVPTVLAVVPWAMQSKAAIGNIQAQAHVAHLLMEKANLPEDEARQAAAGALRYLRDVDPLAPEVRNALGSSAAVLKPNARLWESFSKAQPDIVKQLRTQPLSEQIDALAGMFDTPREKIVKDWYQQVPAKLPSGGRPSQQLSGSILQAARESYEAAGKKAPKVMGPLAKSLGKTLQKTLPTAAVFGLIGGLTSLRAHRAKKKRVEEIRKHANESMLEQGLAAAPGIAAIPGFALGASSPDVFNPEQLIGPKAGKILGSPKGWKSRVVSGVIGAGALGTAAGLPGALYSSAKTIMGSKPADQATAPIMIQKKTAAAVPHMQAELEHIARTYP